jgi:hypothetical protein
MVFTTTSQWSIFAFKPKDAIRKALWFCWRDEEEFVKLQTIVNGKTYTYRICEIDPNNDVSSL